MVVNLSIDGKTKSMQGRMCPRMFLDRGQYSFHFAVGGLVHVKDVILTPENQLLVRGCAFKGHIS